MDEDSLDINQEGCSYGSEYGLSQPVRCADFNSRNVSHLQNEFVQDKSGELQIANHVSCVPRYYGAGRGQLPALRKAVAQSLNRGGALPCSASTQAPVCHALKFHSIEKFKGEKYEHHTTS